MRQERGEGKVKTMTHRPLRAATARTRSRCFRSCMRPAGAWCRSSRAAGCRVRPRAAAAGSLGGRAPQRAADCTTQAQRQVSEGGSGREGGRVAHQVLPSGVITSSSNPQPSSMYRVQSSLPAAADMIASCSAVKPDKFSTLGSTPAFSRSFRVRLAANLLTSSAVTVTATEMRMREGAGQGAVKVTWRRCAGPCFPRGPARSASPDTSGCRTAAWDSCCGWRRSGCLRNRREERRGGIG